MEIIPILLLIVLIVIVLNQTGNISNQVSRLQAEIRSLKEQLAKFSAEKKETLPTASVEKPKPLEVKKEIVIPPVKEPEPVPVIIETEKKITVTTVSIKETITPPAKKEYKAPPPTFFERHPDMEKFIGENLVSKIGIAILVLAIGFFVKYAIDKDWIGATGRVAIGILCGAILIGFAHLLRNLYKAFSSVLAGGGLAVFYFTITLAYQQFHLFSQTVSFAIMVVITAFAVVISLLYNKQELAIIALIGGFAAPFLVSNGSGNYIVLFAYLIVLNTGLLVIAYHKAWRILNLLCFIFTAFIFAGWLMRKGAVIIEGEWINGLLFATVFYLMFFVINIAHNIKEKKKFLAIDFGILLANTCLYFAAGILCLSRLEASDMNGLFCASLGVFHLVASYFLFRKQKTDTNIIYLLIGITLSFVSITAPLQLHGHYITLFWATEAVLLYWLFTKSGILIIKYASLLVWGAMFISLAIDVANIYLFNDQQIAIITNKGFITTGFAAVASYLLFLMHRNEHNRNKDGKSASGFLQGMFRTCAFVFLFAAGALEIAYQFFNHYPGADIYVLYLLLYTVAYVNLLTFFTQKDELQKRGFFSSSFLLVLCLLLYLVNLRAAFRIQYDMLTLQQYGAHFIAHWLTVPLIGIMIYRLSQLIQKSKATTKASYEILVWMLCVAVVIFLSAEVHLLVNTIFYSWYNPLEEIRKVYVKTGLPILWGLCSFGFMWLGMHYKFRALRIISLSLFLLTLLKLFIFDIRNIPAGGKIAAFFCLGVLLLVVSFMYQRLKKIIIEDEEKVD